MSKPETLAVLDALREQADSPTLLHVLKFASRMEAKLAKNRHKGDRAGWISAHPWDWVECMLDETVEVQQCFTSFGKLSVDAEAVADECADVANYCMMIADVVTTDEKERCALAKSANAKLTDAGPEAAPNAGNIAGSISATGCAPFALSTIDAPAKCQKCGSRYVSPTTGKVRNDCHCGGELVTETLGHNEPSSPTAGAAVVERNQRNQNE